MKWSEKLIGSHLSRFFEDKYLCMVPNCGWTGSECDILVVTEKLKIIDVEIKISRSDFKADAKKDKWVEGWSADSGIRWQDYHGDARLRRQWPRKVWKHYYCIPESIWDDSLLEFRGSQASGVILIYGEPASPRLRLHRSATPDRSAQAITPESAMHIARLASLRMWDAYRKLEQRQ